MPAPFHPNATLETVDDERFVIVCARCCRFSAQRRERLIEQFGGNALVTELRYLVAASGGCKLATKQNRSPYNFSLIQCDVRLIDPAKCHSKLRDDVRRGFGITDP